MNFLPSVGRAEYRGEYRIHLTFNDGVENTVDFSQWLDAPVFEPLKDPAYFQRIVVEGGTVMWSHGADVAPETLYGQAKSSEVDIDPQTNLTFLCASVEKWKKCKNGISCDTTLGLAGRFSWRPPGDLSRVLHDAKRGRTMDDTKRKLLKLVLICTICIGLVAGVALLIQALAG